MTVPLARRLFNVVEYHQMAQAGILGEDDRVELIEGEIVEMAPIGSRHQAGVDRLAELFFRQVADRAVVRVQGPIRLGVRSEPQPDITLLLRRPDFYAIYHPGPRDVLLVVEVSDTTIDYDRQVKVPLYAPYGIPELWVVVLELEVVEIYRRPTAEGYQEVSQARRGQRLSPEAFPDLELAVDDILG
jgi:Uma2 family endonuclease